MNKLLLSSLLLSIFVISSCSSQQSNVLNESDAEAFLERVELEDKTLGPIASSAYWIGSNFITYDSQKVVADYFSLSPGELKGKKRTKNIAFPRQVAMYLSRTITEYTTTEVGLEFGGRDHTTVMYACQKIEERIKTDATLEPTIKLLIRKLKGNK